MHKHHTATHRQTIIYIPCRSWLTLKLQCQSIHCAVEGSLVYLISKFKSLISGCFKIIFPKALGLQFSKRLRQRSKFTPTMTTPTIKLKQKSLNPPQKSFLIYWSWWVDNLHSYFDTLVSSHLLQKYFLLRHLCHILGPFSLSIDNAIAWLLSAVSYEW